MTPEHYTDMDILLVDDHEATRDEIFSIVEAEDDLHVIAQAAGGEEGVRRSADLHPDMVVMDVVMPGMNGIEATRIINRANPEIQIIALSNHTGKSLVQTVLDAGASGYVRKDNAYEELVTAMRAVADGKQYVGSGLDA